MMLTFQIVCFGITLFVLQKYIKTGTYSRTHRLLPLVLGLVGVYNIFQVVLVFTGEAEILDLLQQFLLIQMLHLLVFYTLDFLHIRSPQPMHHLMYVFLYVIDIFILLEYGYGEMFEPVIVFFVLFYVVGIVGLATYAYIRNTSTKRETKVSNMLYTAFIVPALALILMMTGIVDSSVYLSLALACSCCILYYLMNTNQLTDPFFILREEYYDSAEIAVVSFDTDFYYLGANQAAKYLFPRELSVPAKRSRPELYMDNIKKMAENMEHPRMIEWEGRYYKCQLGEVHRNEVLRGYNLTIIDITDQKKEVKLMASLKNAAEDRSALKSRFLATMSHDLRSPLHAIIGISDILIGKKELTSKNRALLTHIKTAGETLLTQVNAILDYSKLEAGKLELAENRYDLDDILEELAHMSVINLQSKPVTFVLEMCDEHPAQLIGDEMRVREIIQNLLSNAAKYTSEGEIYCRITCKVLSEENRVFISCSVKDTGPGMSREQLDQIFEEYVSFADNRMVRSSGLGLCIVKQIAEMMGGGVSAESDGVSGSMVSVNFYQRFVVEETNPGFLIDDESVLRQTTAYTYNVRPTYTYPNARVLLADDMRINQEIFRELVLPWKFEIDIVENGRDAVEAVKQRHYEIVFLDQLMPEMLGHEAASAIRSFSDVPIILMTANMSDGVQDEYFNQGFTDFVAKPVDMIVLQRVIEQYMPRDYRHDPTLDDNVGIHFNEKSRELATKRTYKTFLYEIQPLVEQLPDYVEDDLDMFRIKVHGIKGASRQIGRISLSERAEILEMAAKVGNLPFIRDHMQDFQRELEDTLRDVEAEYIRLMADDVPMETESIVKEEVFARLKEGFDNYQLGVIEDAIGQLDCVELTVEESNLLEQARIACDEMDYEAGSALFS